MSAGIPREVTDSDRLAVVDRFGLHDEPGRVPASFGRLVGLAADLLHAPLGFFLMDRARPPSGWDDDVALLVLRAT